MSPRRIAEERERADLLRKLDPATAKTLARAPLQVLRAAATVARPPKPGRDTVIGTPRELAAPKTGIPTTRIQATGGPPSRAAEMDRRMGIRAPGPAIVDNGASLVFGTMRPAEARAAIEARAGVTRAAHVRDEGNRLVFPTMKPADVRAVERERDDRRTRVVASTTVPGQARGGSPTTATLGQIRAALAVLAVRVERLSAPAAGAA